MHKALQVELQDWQRDQEPDTDHEGFYQTSLPTIITQVNMPCRYTRSKATHSRSVWPVGTLRTKQILHAIHVFCVVCLFCVLDAWGECPGGSHDRTIPTRSDYTDGAVRDGEPPEQVLVHASLASGCLSAFLLFSMCQSGSGESSLSPPFLYITGFEKLWWNLGRSIARIWATTKTSSTSTIFWPPSATASSSSEIMAQWMAPDQAVRA